MTSKSATKAVRLDATIEPRAGDLDLEVGAYFATDQFTYSRSRWFGFVQERYAVAFGFGGGELLVSLENAMAPIRHRYCPSLDEFVELEVAQENSDSWEDTLGFGIDITKDPKLSLSAASKQALAEVVKQRVLTRSAAMVTKGDDSRPEWEFAARRGLILWGRAPRAGTVLAKLSQFAPSVTAKIGFAIDESNIKCMSIRAGNQRNQKKAALVLRALPRYLKAKWGEKGLGKVGVALAVAHFTSSGLTSERAA